MEQAAGDQGKGEIEKQRQAIHDLVKHSVRDSRRPASQASAGSQMSRLTSRKPALPNNLKPVRTRRLSSTVTSSDAEDDDDDDDEDEDEMSDDDPLCPGEVVQYKFVYSHAVTHAMEEVRAWPPSRRRFYKDDVHIFNLPEIVHNCSPRNPFTPAVTKRVRQNKRHMPRPGDVDSIQRSRRRFKSFTEDKFGVYLSWTASQLETVDAASLLPRPTYVSKKDRDPSEAPSRLRNHID